MISHRETVADSCAVEAGPAFKSAHFGGEGEGVRLLRGENIEPGSLRWVNTRTWPAQHLAGCEHLLMMEGDLVLGMDRPIVSAGLKLAEVGRGDLPALLVQRVARLRANAIDGRYLYHWLSTPGFAARLQRAATGTQLPHITLRDIREYPVPRYGPAAERRIVAILEEHLSDLDDADRSFGDAAARLERLTTALLWSATHGVGGSRRVMLDEIAEVRLGRQRSPKNHTGPRMRPYLRAANVDWDRLRLDDVAEMNFSASEEDTYRLMPGDILLAEASGSAAEVGKSALYAGVPSNVCFQNTLLRVRCHHAEPEFVQKYLLAEARAGRFMPESRGVGINHLGRARLASLVVDLPTETLQRETAQRVTELLQQVARTEALTERQRVRGKSLRSAILNAAFSGRLTGHGSDTDVISELAEEESA